MACIIIRRSQKQGETFEGGEVVGEGASRPKRFPDRASAEGYMEEKGYRTADGWEIADEECG